MGIIGIWLCLVFILVYRHYISGVEFSPLQTLSESQFKTSDDWYGIYIQDRKIGYMKASSEKIGNEYRFMQSSKTDFNTDEGKRITGSAKFKCLTDLEYRIKSFEFESWSGEEYFKSYGELDEDNILLVFIETGEQKRTETKEIHGKPFLPATVKQMLIARGLEKGKRYKVPILNIFTLEVEDAIIEVLDLIPHKIGIHVLTTYLLKIGENFSWITDGGYTLKEKYSSGVLYIQETENTAKSKEYDRIFDFLSLSAIKANKLLSDPLALSYLKIRLSGVDLTEYPLLDGGRQVLKGDFLEISKEKVETLKDRTYKLPFQGKDKDVDSFLKPSPFVQSDHHTIIYNANKFVALEKNAFRLARFLTGNLYLTVQKRPMFQIVTAMDVFKDPVGGCNEHTVIFTAFSRAGGLPTRMVGGLVYNRGHFYFHTWPEVWIDEWVPADPTMGQFPADVTHIRLMEGDIDQLIPLAEIIGNLKIDILEAL
jgi:hypothetical protein